MHSEIITRYCKHSGESLDEVLAKKTDRATVLRRNALLYLTWKEAEKTVTYSRKKSYVLTEVATTFRMKRVNALEQLAIFEANLVMPDVRKMLERVKVITVTR